MDKAKVVVALRGGLITIDELRRLYTLTFEELEIWQKEFDRGGVRGLRVTRISPRRN